MIPKRIIPVVFIAMAAALFFAVPAMVQKGASIRHAQFEPIWTAQSERKILSTPVITHDRLIYGTNEGMVEALSVLDGTRIWSVDFQDPVFALSLDDNGIIYIGTGLHFHTQATLAAIDPETGYILWKTEFEGHIEEAFTFDEASHRMWIGSGKSGLWAVDMRSGDVLWNKALGHLDGTPLLHGNILYVPAQKDEERKESYFYALDADSGKILWQVDQPGQPWATPVLNGAGDTIFTSTGIGQIGLKRDTDQGWAQALALSGEALWQIDLPGMPMTPPIYLPEEGRLTYVTKGGVVTAIDPVNGREVWQADLGGDMSAEGIYVPDFQESILATMTRAGIFYLLDLKDGSILYKKDMGQKTNTAPLYHDGIFYLATTRRVTAMRVQE